MIHDVDAVEVDDSVERNPVEQTIADDVFLEITNKRKNLVEDEQVKVNTTFI